MYVLLAPEVLLILQAVVSHTPHWQSHSPQKPQARQPDSAQQWPGLNRSLEFRVSLTPTLGLDTALSLPKTPLHKLPKENGLKGEDRS